MNYRSKKFLVCIVWCFSVLVALNFCHQGTKTPNPTKSNILTQL